MMNSSATLEMTLVSALVKDNYQVKYLHDRVSPEIFFFEFLAVLLSSISRLGIRDASHFVFIYCISHCLIQTYLIIMHEVM